MPKLIVEIEYPYRPESYNTDAIEQAVTSPEQATKLDASLVDDEGLLVFLGWLESEEIPFTEKTIGWAT